MLPADQALAFGRKSRAAKQLIQSQKQSAAAVQAVRQTTRLTTIPAGAAAVNAQVSRAAAQAAVQAAARPPRPPEISFSKPKWDMETRMKELLKEYPNPTLALQQVWELQGKNGNLNMFSVLAMRYYLNNFGLVTPHLHKLFKKIASFNNRKVESRFIARMRFLAENQQPILREITSQHIPQVNIRMRYTADVDKITTQNFNAQKLVLSIEKHMSPVPEKDLSIRHVNGQSKFQTSSEEYNVYKYAGPTDLIPTLYRYLINGRAKRAPVTVVFDEQAKSLAMYNEDKTLWLRVTPHEYENPKKLHVHLNEQRTVTFTDAEGKERTVTVNANLSIPLTPPENMPSHPEMAQRFLYEKLVLNPVKNMRGDKHAAIEERSIF